MSASALARARSASVAFFPAALALATGERAVTHEGTPPLLSGGELGGWSRYYVEAGSMGALAPSPGGGCHSGLTYTIGFKIKVRKLNLALKRMHFFYFSALVN